MFNPIIDGDFVHNDDRHDAGRALNAVRFITIDYDAVAARNVELIRANIARRKKREAKGAIVAATLMMAALSPLTSVL